MEDSEGPAAAFPLARDISDRFFLFLSCSGVMVLASLFVPVPGVEKLLLGAGAGLLSLALLAGVLQVAGKLGNLLEERQARRLLRDEKGPALLCDVRGRIAFLNAQAGRFPGARSGQSVQELVSQSFGFGASVVERLSIQARRSGVASETVAIRGETVRFEVRHLPSGHTLWSLEQRAEPGNAEECSDLVAILSVDPSGRILSLNRLARELLNGFPATLEAVLGPDPFLSGQRRDIRTTGETATVSVIEIKNSDGWREIVLLPLEREQESQVDGLLAEPRLLEALPVPMLKIAADGMLIEANREARTILSLDNGPLPPLFELVEGMGRPIADWLSDAAAGRGLLKPEIVRAVTPGQELFLQIALGRAVENGEVVLVGILNDATELKTLEAQFVQSQKMQAIGQLAGGVAHDFNNLLTAISGHCDLLLLRHDPGDPDYADLIQISQNSNRAASLVGQLLAFSRKQNLKPQALDLRDTMSDLAHLLNRLIGERIQLDVIHAPGEQVIRADRRQLEQVIVNLVVNARDAMPEGGRISVTIRSETLSAELVRDRAHVLPGDYIVIEVSDTGVGISPDGLVKVFEPFYTTKKTGEGTGLGLSTAYGIVKQTGGFIFVDSTPGEGTKFSLYFPAAEASEKPIEQPRANVPLPVPTRCDGVILLVEDEAPVRAFASRALRMRGYTVLEAENAEEALKTLEDPGLKVDVFVTDVIMPGLDGPTWVRQALRQRPDTRTVFVSGYSEEGRVEKQARIPNSVFLPKPFSLHQLTAVVNEQLA